MSTVEITFLGEQYAEGEADNCLLKAKGTLEKTETGYVLAYTEPDEEMGNSKSEIIVHSTKKVELKRSGAYTTVFLIEEGKKHTCLYKTPFGEMNMDIVADTVSAQLYEKGGNIRLCYRLESNSQLIGENTLIMNIKAV